MNSTPKVSVVIPHYRDLAGLNLCLEAMNRQTYPSENYEIIVADNASPEGPAAIADAISGRARLVVVAERGAGPARNGGVAAATGEILAFTDSDCRPEPEWLANGVAALSHHDFVGGAMRVLVDDVRRMTAAEAFESVFAFDNEDYVLRKGFTVTANLFCPRKIFDEVGGFRVGVSEDLDWSHRAGVAGHRIGYAGDAVVGHPARKTWPELQTKWRRLNAETFGIVAGGEHGRLRWLLKSLALPISALVHTPRILTSPKLGGPGQRLAALAMLYRLRLWRSADGLRLLAVRKA